MRADLKAIFSHFRRNTTNSLFWFPKGSKGRLLWDSSSWGTVYKAMYKNMPVYTNAARNIRVKM